MLHRAGYAADFTDLPAEKGFFKKIHHIGVDIHKNHAGAKLAVFIDTSQILMKLAILRKFWVKIEK